jgi:hypothetical protein
MEQVTALVDRTEANARRLLAVGLVAFTVGALLLAGISTSPLGSLIGGAIVLGGPLVIFLKSGEQTPKQAASPYLAVIALFLVGMSLAHHWGLPEIGRILGWVGLLEGLIYAWGAFRAWQMLDPARHSLGGPTFDVRLEVEVRKGFMGAPYTEARLWQMDSDSAPPLVQFGWHQSTSTVPLEKVPAQVHGVPVKGSVVGVSSAGMAVIGRVRSSHFGEEPTPPKKPSALAAWLWKPRSLRIR